MSTHSLVASHRQCPRCHWHGATLVQWPVYHCSRCDAWFKATWKRKVVLRNPL
jgi:hypothetical protein